MIGSLQGVLSYQAENQLLLDVQGVGYEVTCAGSVLENAPALGSSLKLIVYTDVKENSISLYGFSSILEKQVFLLLKKVKGIGSKLALGVISSVGAEQLLVNIGRGDIGALKQVPGIGQKTAERVIVELRESVGEFAGVGEGEARRPAGRGGKTETPAAAAPEKDVLLALEKLGFARERAQKAVERALARGAQDDDVGELLRLSLSEI